VQRHGCALLRLGAYSWQWNLQDQQAHELITDERLLRCEFIAMALEEFKVAMVQSQWAVHNHRPWRR
jgi:hypothetical protein